MNPQRKRRNVIGRLLQPWWRLTRGLTLGAQGVVVDADSKVLLIRHGYRPGWHFPGGGVERGETLESALARELLEEAGVIIKSRAQFHGMFANNASFPGDHIALFVVRQWEQPIVPEPNVEVAEQQFFAPRALPKGVEPGVRRRIDEIFYGAACSAEW